MSRCILLLNRASGGNQRGLDPREVCQTTEQIFTAAAHVISSDLIAAQELESALALAIGTRPHAILVGGGDGTVSTAARLLGGTGIAMGILPMGTFNLAARDFGVPLEIDAAARFLADAGAFPVDVLEVAGHACLCTTILGFYPEFSKIFENRDHGGRWWKKTLKLITGLRATFVNARAIPLSWECDGNGGGTARTKFSAFVPGRYKDSAGLIPARTEFSSGKLTAYIGKQEKPAAVLRAMVDYTLGLHEHNAALEIVTGSRMTLRAARRKSCRAMLDGEILRLSFPIELRVRPKHLMVLTTEEVLSEAPTLSAP